MNEEQLFSFLVRGFGVLVVLEGLSTLYVALAQWELNPPSLEPW
jgi:hypothetical protein